MPKIKSPGISPYSARDRRDAVRVLRTARTILLNEECTFPTLEAARRKKVSTDSRAWALITQARDTVDGQRDAHQLELAIALIERGWVPNTAPKFKLARVPRCPKKVPGGRCGRPLPHTHGCALHPLPTDLVRSIGIDHVLIGGPPTETAMIVAWPVSDTGNDLRVRRDDHDRGLWIDAPSEKTKPTLLGWPEVRRLTVELNLELADHPKMPR